MGHRTPGDYCQVSSTSDDLGAADRMALPVVTSLFDCRIHRINIDALADIITPRGHAGAQPVESDVL